MNYLLIAAGVVALWTAVASPIAHLDHHLLTAHMGQHLLVMLVAAPCLLAGARSYLRRCRPGRTSLFELAQRLPIVCWFAGTMTVIFWHVPAVFDLACGSRFWHEFQQASFLVAGVMFWLPVIQPVPGATPQWWLPLYLFLATLPCDALSAFLTFCGHVVYRPYLAGSGHFGLSPLEDQALAGAFMWVTVTFAYLAPALVVTARLLSGGPRQLVEVGAI